jgi:hypothetical protein
VELLAEVGDAVFGSPENGPGRSQIWIGGGVGVAFGHEVAFAKDPTGAHHSVQDHGGFLVSEYDSVSGFDGGGCCGLDQNGVSGLVRRAHAATGHGHHPVSMSGSHNGGSQGRGGSKDQ